MSFHLTARRALFGLLAFLALVAIGCGDDGGSDTSGGASAGSAESDYVEQVKADVEQHYTGTYTGPPDAAPAAEPGKNVWIISAGQAATISVMATGGAEDAAEALGWETTIYDGKFDPAEWANGIRQAIADGADGIVLYLIDCNLVRGPLTQARKAGITVVAGESIDCNETDPDQESLFDGMPEYVEGTYAEWIKEYGRLQAQWLIAQTDGEAHVLYPRTDEVQGYTLIREGAEEELAKCPDCSIEYYEWRQADLGPQLRQKTEQALLRNPNANAMILPLDAMATAGVGAALTATGRRDMLVIGAEGEEANIEMIKEDDPGMDAGVGIPTRYEGFAMMDVLLRLFADEKPAPSGMGLQIYDAEHNLPESGTYQAPVDFETAYLEAWGAK